MTSSTRLQRFGAPIAASLLTAGLLVAGLWVQHARSGWPFEPSDATAAAGRSAAAAPASIDIHRRVPVDAAATQALDIRLETVGRESLVQAVRAVATIVPDESRISHVHTRVSGWVEHLDVSTTGERVEAGQPLARIFSQELFSSQIEYLAARRNTAAAGITSAVVASGRTRLGVLGMTPDEIDGIEASGEPARLVTIVAPRGGVVVNRGVTAGTSVDPSTTLLTIADLSRVWILAEVPEASIPAVPLGAAATLDFPASGRSPFRARVDFVYPTLTERTRTLRVRLSAANPGGALRPGLYGTAVFEGVGQDVMTVPRDAVVDTGLQQHVFVAVGDRFEPRPVTLGAQLADRVEIRAGLREGDRIVAAGVFLLDSESRLRATGGSGGHNHGGSSAAPEAGGETTSGRAPVGGSGRTTAPSAANPDATRDPHDGHAPAAGGTPPDPHAGHGTAVQPPADPHAGHGPTGPTGADPHANHRE